MVQLLIFIAAEVLLFFCTSSAICMVGFAVIYWSVWLMVWRPIQKDERRLTGNGSKVKSVLKGLGVTFVSLLGFLGFAFVETVMTGSNLANPSEMLLWLGLVGTDLAVTIGVVTKILRM